MSDKETKELLVAANELSIAIIKVLKKHLGVVDVASALLGDEELRAAIVAAVEGISAVPEEIKAMSGSDYLDLAQAQIALIPKIVEALKG